MGGFNLQELMSQAKQQYETLQKKMQETVVEGSAGGGTVTVKMDGRKQVLSIKIDPEAVKADDLEMLQDLITAAINGAGQKVDEVHAVDDGRDAWRNGNSRIVTILAWSKHASLHLEEQTGPSWPEGHSG